MEKRTENETRKMKSIANLISIVAKNGNVEGCHINLFISNPFPIVLNYYGKPYKHYINKLYIFDKNVYICSTIIREDLDNVEDDSAAEEFNVDELENIVEALQIIYPYNRKPGELRINPAGEEEIINISLDKEHTPIAYQERIADLMDSGLTFDEAKKMANEPLEMEVYFQRDEGLFLVESEAVANTEIFSPYTAKRYKASLE